MLALELDRCRRSCGRHIGPAAKSAVFPLEVWAKLDDSWDRPQFNWSRGTPEVPINVRSALLEGCWWGLREIELSCLRHQQVTLLLGEGCGYVNLELSASKTDHMALGKTRGHGCSCPSPGCPVKAVVHLMQQSKAHLAFESYDHQGGHAPLVMDSRGQFCENAMIKNALCLVAEKWGLAAKSSAHAMRAMGSQAMARAGVPLWKIQLFMRWGSSVVLGYLGDAPLASKESQRLSKDVAAGLDLAEMRDDIIRSLAPQVTTKADEKARAQLDQRIRILLEEALAGLALESDRLVAKAVVQRVVEQGPCEDDAKAVSRLVLNSAPQSMKVHRTTEGATTLCGWSWGQSPTATIVSRGHKYEECRTCFK